MEIPIKLCSKSSTFTTYAIDSDFVELINYDISFKSTHRKENQHRLDEFLSPPEVLTYNEIAART
jgi:hypothetical protein